MEKESLEQKVARLKAKAAELDVSLNFPILTDYTPLITLWFKKRLIDYLHTDIKFFELIMDSEELFSSSEQDQILFNLDNLKPMAAVFSEEIKRLELQLDQDQRDAYYCALTKFIFGEDF